MRVRVRASEQTALPPERARVAPCERADSTSRSLGRCDDDDDNDKTLDLRVVLSPKFDKRRLRLRASELLLASRSTRPTDITHSCYVLTRPRAASNELGAARPIGRNRQRMRRCGLSAEQQLQTTARPLHPIVLHIRRAGRAARMPMARPPLRLANRVRPALPFTASALVLPVARGSVRFAWFSLAVHLAHRVNHLSRLVVPCKGLAKDGK